jgi:hypothetical protein
MYLNRRSEAQEHVYAYDFREIRNSDHRFSMIQDLITSTVSITSESLRRLHMIDFVVKKNIYRLNGNRCLRLENKYEEMLRTASRRKYFDSDTGGL